MLCLILERKLSLLFFFGGIIWTVPTTPLEGGCWVYEGVVNIYHSYGPPESQPKKKGVSYFK